MQVGNPKGKATTERFKRNYFYLKQGTQSYRILPPMGSLATAGIWSRYYAVHFGYENSEGRMKPFLSCEEKNRQTRMIEVKDAALDRLNILKSQLAAVSERVKTSPSPALKKELERLNSLVGFGGQFKLEKRHFVNVVNERGEIGLLQLKHKEKLALDEARKEIQKKYNVDPVGVEGVYLDFKKSGKGLDTLVQVSGTMTLQSDGSEKIKRHALDEALIARLDAEAFELDSLYVALSSEEIEAIVRGYDQNEDEGKRVVTEVFKGRQNTRYSKENNEEVVESKPVSSTGKNTVLQSDPPDLSMDEEIDPVESTVSASSAAAELSKNSSQSDDDFLKSIGVPV